MHGYTVAFVWAAGRFGIGLLVALVVLPLYGLFQARTAQAEARRELAAGS